MKTRSLALVAIVMGILVGCSCEKQNLLQKTEGEWIGTIDLEIDVYDNGGGLVTQEINAEIELEIKGDSTFTSVIIAEKQYRFKLDGITNISNDTLKFDAVLELSDKVALDGYFLMEKKDKLHMEYTGEAGQGSVVHKGVATMSKIGADNKKENRDN